jgi:hypothetical protein
MLSLVDADDNFHATYFMALSFIPLFKSLEKKHAVEDRRDDSINFQFFRKASLCDV